MAVLKPATGMGALDWTDFQLLIERHLGDLPIPVYVYSTYHPGVKAKEPGRRSQPILLSNHEYGSRRLVEDCMGHGAQHKPCDRRRMVHSHHQEIWFRD